MTAIKGSRHFVRSRSSLRRAKVLNETISELVMMLCALFRGHRFDSRSEKLLIAFAASFHQVNN